MPEYTVEITGTFRATVTVEASDETGARILAEARGCEIVDVNEVEDFKAGRVEFFQN